MREVLIRGHHFVLLAAIFDLIALLLLIFVFVGQVNPGIVSKSISMVNMDVSVLGGVIQDVSGVPTPGLYNLESRTIGLKEGLQYTYSWGLFTVCGYLYNATFDGGGGCSSSTAAFQPFEVILNDTPPGYSSLVALFILNSNGVDQFTSSDRLTSYANAAYYLIILSIVTVTLALIAITVRTALTFRLSASSICLATVFLLISASLWTTVIAQAKSINGVRRNNQDSLGIMIQQGNAVSMLWAAFSFTLLSILPTYITVHTYRQY